MNIKDPKVQRLIKEKELREMEILILKGRCLAISPAEYERLRVLKERYQ